MGLAASAAVALGATAATLVVDTSSEFRPTFSNAQKQVPGNQSPAHVSADHVPRPTPNAIASSNPGLAFSVSGLNFNDQRTADGGNKFSLEPPDQAFCVGNGLALEAVNDVFAFYNTSGVKQGGTMALNPFFTLDHQFDRTTGAVGEDLFDPKCYYDPVLGRFFFVIDHLGVNPATGALNGNAFVDIAVSKTSTPTTSRSDWFFYQLNVKNNGTGGTPSHPNCPCFGDQSLIGADTYGFFMSTN